MTCDSNAKLQKCVEQFRDNLNKHSPTNPEKSAVTQRPMEGLNSHPNTLKKPLQLLFLAQESLPSSTEPLQILNWGVGGVTSLFGAKIQSKPFPFLRMCPIFPTVRQLSHENNRREAVRSAAATYANPAFSMTVLIERVQLLLLSVPPLSTPVLTKPEHRLLWKSLQAAT